MNVLGSVFTPPSQVGAFVGNGVSTRGRATTWTVNLGSWLQQQPLRALQLCQAIVTWGGGDDGGSANQTVTIDYPTQGTAFHVHGNEVRVQFAGAVSSLDLAGSRSPPELSAWLTPAKSMLYPLSPTLTTGTILIIAQATNVQIVPPRARAFRLLRLDQQDIVIVQASQFSNNATPAIVASDLVGSPTAALTGQIQLPAHRAAWYPLAHEAATVTFSNLDLTQLTQFRVQWLLEMG